MTELMWFTVGFIVPPAIITIADKAPSSSGANDCSENV